MVVCEDGKFLGVLGVMDTPRAVARSVIEQLEKLGIERMLMLSGDHQQVADAVAASVGLHEAQGDLMPEDKVNKIRLLSAQGGVAMVGDGVNDAPAMAGATVGIAMGAAGSDGRFGDSRCGIDGRRSNHLPFAIGLEPGHATHHSPESLDQLGYDCFSGTSHSVWFIAGSCRRAA